MISVIIPAYNCETTLERAVDSVLNQSYKDFELIIVNDGSTDGTEQVARRLAQKNARVRVVTTENSGEGGARNNGMDAATGAYFCFIDSDDWVEPDYLTAMMDQLGEGTLPCVGICYNGDGKSYLKELPGDRYEVSERTAEDLLAGSLGDEIQNSACNKLFDASILRERSIRFFGGYKVGEDLLFTIRYLLCCKRVTVDNRALYCYYHNPSSAMRSVFNDLVPPYDKLLSKLIELKEDGMLISDEALQAWSLDKMMYSICKGYPLTLSASDFREYCRNTVFTGILYRYAIRDNSKTKLQRRVFRFALRTKNTVLLRALIKGKKALR